MENYSNLSETPPPSLSQRPLSCMLFQVCPGENFKSLKSRLICFWWSDFSEALLNVPLPSLAKIPGQQHPSSCDSAWIRPCWHVWPPCQCQGILYFFLNVSHLISQIINMYGAGQCFWPNSLQSSWPPGALCSRMHRVSPHPKAPRKCDQALQTNSLLHVGFARINDCRI